MSANNLDIYDPIEQYKNKFKDEFTNSATKYFDELVEKSKVDVSANKQISQKITKLEEKLEQENKLIKKKKNIKIFLIVLLVIFLVGIILTLWYVILSWSHISNTIKIPVIIGTILVSFLEIFLLFWIFKKINPKLKELKIAVEKTHNKQEEQIEIAYQQLENLNNSFNLNIPQVLLQKLLPIFSLDSYLTKNKQQELNVKNLSKFESVVFAQTGDIYGNPFLIYEKKIHEMSEKIYTGSLTVSWTETERDSNGKTRMVTKYETLTASVIKPFPNYYNDSALIYKTPAAPKLSFSRSPQNIGGLSERQIEKEISKLEKKNIKAVNKNETFNMISSNPKFEVAFGSTDRNNEKDFRLIFDKTSQNQMIKLLSDTEVGFGDNFHMEKKGEIVKLVFDNFNNDILDDDPYVYITYDIEEMRKTFINHLNEYFHHFYFLFAPILSINLFRELKSNDYIYGKIKNTDELSSWQVEEILNKFNPDLLNHPDSITENILKSELVNSEKDFEIHKVTSIGFEGINQIDYIPRTARNGSVHMVPVPWVEYLPVEKTSNVYLKKSEKIQRAKLLENGKLNDNWNEFLEKQNTDIFDSILKQNILSFVEINPLQDEDEAFLRKKI
ncbi:hypothetical protein ESOMN_v1c06730 [Williamsoniiplasma somnilux]|uniref:Uncharacterized protein n=1 Tax=Williamsoniiplasma somnilux TaxID=215578 RepID=A0A2K8NZ10_9MOLU|nr:hypothetical protein [Williamsoniiplasma somnilux]ATZ19055.1 hypothetical protein ESOMN_v1c06730 [Williamsoniiplasma somnilux]